eukprot:SM000037S13565  [mRNA]  locus=s37:650358:651510:- [translate_table: standard]
MATAGIGAAPIAVYGGGSPVPVPTELPPYAAAPPPSALQEPASASEPPRGGGGVERRPKYERRRGGDTCCDFLWRFLQSLSFGAHHPLVDELLLSGSVQPRQAWTSALLRPLLRMVLKYTIESSLAAAVCSFSVTIASNTGRLRFQNMATTTYLVVGTVIAAAWALFMLHVDLVLLAVGLSVHSRSYHLAVFLLDFVRTHTPSHQSAPMTAAVARIVLCDGLVYAARSDRLACIQVAATFALTAGSALAGLATFEVRGNYAYAQTLCQGATPFDRWCSRVRAGAALAILAFAFFLPSLAIDISDLGKEVQEETEEAK